jgi:hypothetical protein
LIPPQHEIVDRDALDEVTFFCISPKNLLRDFFYSLDDLQNLRGQSPKFEPDAANPRQVDAVRLFHFCFFDNSIFPIPTNAMMVDRERRWDNGIDLLPTILGDDDSIFSLNFFNA